MQEQKNNKGYPSERLLRGKTQEEKDEFVRAYKRAKRVLKELNKYAAHEVRVQTDIIDSPKGFESPNWAYLQAWYAGYRVAMRRTLDITRT
jgi:hypothetical protein